MHSFTLTLFPVRYEQSDWGWSDREKREELTDSRAWYLLARTPEGRPVAFSHFRFDMEEGEEVLYWSVEVAILTCSHLKSLVISFFFSLHFVCAQNVCQNGSSFTWRQPCNVTTKQRCKYITDVNVQKVCCVKLQSFRVAYDY